MSVLNVKGGQTLQGKVKVSGAKNAATKLLVASLLSDKVNFFHNIPDIGDVNITLSLCEEIGSQIYWEKNKRILKIHTPKIENTNISTRFSKVNRIPILLIGALLARCKEVIIPILGGDDIGERNINFHIHALQQMGVSICLKDGYYIASAFHGLKGAVIELDYPSVGTTENIIFAAVRAKGKTVIKNAAIEPEIMDILYFLQKLGANVSLDSDRTIVIIGTDSFNEVEHNVMPDRIEAASFGMAAIASKGSVFVEGMQQSHMFSFLAKLQQIGAGIEVKDSGIAFYYDKPLKGGIVLETDVHPGFMTDWQQPFSVLLTQAKGLSIIHETVYENRLSYLNSLKTMGADYELFSECLGSKRCRYNLKLHQHSVVIRGITPLKGACINIPDLRAGFAYLMAALIAEGESVIMGGEFLERGYEDFVGKFSLLGAKLSYKSSLSTSLFKKLEDFSLVAI